MTGFPIPSAAFEILKGRLHPKPSPIVGKALAIGGLIRNHQQCFFVVGVPGSTQVGLDGWFLPQGDGSKKAGSRSGSQICHRTGWQPAVRGGSSFTGMVPTHPKHVVPSILLTELDH